LLLKNKLEYVIKIFSFFDLLFLKKYRLIINAPQGPTISDISYKEKKFLTLYPLYYAKIFSVPYCVIGVSIGPFNKKSYKEKWVEYVLMNAQKIILREDISYKNVKNKYPYLNNLLSSIDIVFSDNSSIKEQEKHFEDYIEYRNSLDNSCIGGCISLTPPRTPLNEFNRSEYIKKITCFFEFAIKYTGRKLLLFPHLKKDYQYLREIKTSSKYSKKIEIFPAKYNSDYQQDIIKYLDFFISSRYHPTIFTIKAQTPFFCIINQFKTLGMLRKLNLVKKDIWQDDSLDLWKKYFIKAWDNRDYFRKDINTAYKNAKNMSKLYYQVLKDLLA
jgi:polysaccharide pyruvyl transferase WcaK-like protein